MDRVADVLRGIVTNAGIQPAGHLLLELVQLSAYVVDHLDDVGVGLGEDTGKYRSVSGVAHHGVIIFGAKLHFGDVLQAHDGTVLLVDHETAELCRVVHVCVRSQIGLHQRAFGVADRCQVVVGRERLAHLRRADVQSRHAFGPEPDAHGEGTRAEDFNALYPGHCREARLNHADQVVGDLFRREDLRPKAEICGSHFRVGGLHADRGHLGLGGQVVAYLIDFG